MMAAKLTNIFYPAKFWDLQSEISVFHQKRVFPHLVTCLLVFADTDSIQNFFLF